MKRFRIFYALLIVLIVASCNSKPNKESNEESQAGMHKVEVLETIDVSTYTYLRVKENKEEYWMAVTKRNVDVGGVYYYDSRVEMRDFESSELNKTFDVIYFVEEISDKPESHHSHMMPPHGKDVSEMHPKHENPKNAADIKIDPVEGGITIAELFKNREKYRGKKVLIKGKVVKVNAQIMNRNWVHLQDGTEDNGNFDLTITTNESVELNTVLTFEGRITLEKDFGAGYFYEVIMEDAKLIKEL